MRGVVRAVLTVVVLSILSAGMTIFSSNWTTALVPIGIIALVCINLEPLVEFVIHISRDERGGP